MTDHTPPTTAPNPHPDPVLTSARTELPGFGVAAGKHRSDRDHHRRALIALSWYLIWASAVVTAFAVLFTLVDLAVGGGASGAGAGR